MESMKESLRPVIEAINSEAEEKYKKTIAEKNKILKPMTEIYKRQMEDGRVRPKWVEYKAILEEIFKNPEPYIYAPDWESVKSEFTVALNKFTEIALKSGSDRKEEFKCYKESLSKLSGSHVRSLSFSSTASVLSGAGSASSEKSLSPLN